jgi:hypothetical protein
MAGFWFLHHVAFVRDMSLRRNPACLSSLLSADPNIAGFWFRHHVAFVCDMSLHRKSRL